VRIAGLRALHARAQRDAVLALEARLERAADPLRRRELGRPARIDERERCARDVAASASG
jgi:hypothetical protein